MIELVRAYVIPAAYAVLPSAMNSPQATAMLLAIGLQESRFTQRRQAAGPARGIFQFEAAGVHGVLTHERTVTPIRVALHRLCYSEPFDSGTLLPALEHNDILAAVFARLLLWSLPGTLPEPTDTVGGWKIYMAGWRPGRARRETWDANYLASWDRVISQPRNA